MRRRIINGEIYVNLKDVVKHFSMEVQYNSLALSSQDKFTKKNVIDFTIDAAFEEIDKQIIRQS